MTPTQLRTARRALGWSQTRLAEELDLSLRIILYYEAGEMVVPRTVVLSMRWFELVKGSPAMIEGRPTT